MSEFRTRVVGVSGVWPSRPAKWSYSSLAEAEECPRRWALLRASYPTVWGGRGYPRRPSIAALAGTAAHRSVERIIHALVSSGSCGVDDPMASTVLRSLGGLSGVLSEVVDTLLDEQAANPRTLSVLPDLRRRMIERSPTVRTQVQQLLSRVRLSPETRLAGGPPGGDVRRLAQGSYPEQLLEADGISLMGLVDLLLVVAEGACIVDYKTGEPRESHLEQAMTYAVLWVNDVRRNPSRLPVIEVCLAYPSWTRTLEVTGAEVAAAGDDLRRRVDAANAAVSSEPPETRVDEEHCSMCPVRHLCDEYWSFRSVTPFKAAERFPLDVAVKVVDLHSERRAAVALEGVPGAVMLSASMESVVAGDTLRLLGVYSELDPDSGTLVLSAGRYSEVYRLTESS